MNTGKYQLLAYTYTSKEHQLDQEDSRNAVYLLHAANSCPSRSTRIRHTPVVAVRYEEGKVRSRDAFFNSAEG